MLYWHWKVSLNDTFIYLKSNIWKSSIEVLSRGKYESAKICEICGEINLPSRSHAAARRGAQLKNGVAKSQLLLKGRRYENREFSNLRQISIGSYI